MDIPASLSDYDDRERWRCPQLGGPVTFNYCRRMSSGNPCSRVVECWAGAFDIADYLMKHFSEEDIRQILSTPPRDRWSKILGALPDSNR
ncbi:MAG: hypothetical protein ABIH23_23020 [bacterium]